MSYERKIPFWKQETDLEDEWYFIKKDEGPIYKEEYIEELQEELLREYIKSIKCNR